MSINCAFLPSTGSNLLTWPADAPDLTSSEQPNRPLSDATSVTTPINGHMCNLPYRINNWDMHFCLRQNKTDVYTCPTFTSNMSICASGKYGFAFTNSTDSFDQTYTSFVRNSTVGEQCLTFYYYFTDESRNPKIDILSGLSFGSSLDDIRIVTVTPQTENKWYKRQISFFTNSSNYALKFKLSRDSGINSTEFYFALDDILITSELCELELDNFTMSTDEAMLTQLTSTTELIFSINNNTSHSIESITTNVSIDSNYLTSPSENSIIVSESSSKDSTPIVYSFSTDSIVSYESPSADLITESKFITTDYSVLSEFSSLKSSTASVPYFTDSTIRHDLTIPSESSSTTLFMAIESSSQNPTKTSTNSISDLTTISQLFSTKPITSSNFSSNNNNNNTFSTIFTTTLKRTENSTLPIISTMNISILNSTLIQTTKPNTTVRFNFYNELSKLY
ncbi:unnamed protein product [Rotaria sp. Silwood2]|nr:unnamed protein product [Rotaria sp. Silwood2]